MMQKCYILCSLVCLVLSCAVLHAQDSSRIISSPIAPHTSQVSTTSQAIKKQDTAVQAISHVGLPSFTDHLYTGYSRFIDYLLTHNRLFSETEHPVSDISSLIKKDPKKNQNDEQFFYILMGAFFLLAVVRLAFRKYFSDLFSAFFNPAFSRRQLKEQLFQTPFPAFLLNLFFNIAAGLYLYIILWHFDYITSARPFYLISVFVLLFIFIYLIKFLFLRFSGWLFGYPEMMNTYIFTLYLVNKVLGIILLPFILILAFSPPVLAKLAFNISLFIIIVMIIYRYIRAWPAVQNQVSFNKFHFFLYLCGFEIAPILIIGKLVLIWLNGA